MAHLENGDESLCPPLRSRSAVGLKDVGAGRAINALSRVLSADGKEEAVAAAGVSQSLPIASAITCPQAEIYSARCISPHAHPNPNGLTKVRIIIKSMKHTLPLVDCGLSGAHVSFTAHEHPVRQAPVVLYFTEEEN